MKFIVGVLGLTDGWKILLEQEGVSYIEVSSRPTPEAMSVLIVSSVSTSTEIDTVKRYVEQGGALLCPSTVFATLFALPLHGRFVEYISFLSSEILSSVGILWVDTECSLPPQLTEGVTNKGDKAVLLTPYGKGIIAVVPFAPDHFVLDTRSCDRSFYAPYKRLPFETVSCISKASLRQLIHRILVHLHHYRSLPYIHRWYFPNTARSVFGLRIDTDFGNREQIEQVGILLSKYSLSATWFLDVENQRNNLQLFRSFKYQELALHCNEHVRFTTEDRWRLDVVTALTTLREYGITPKGYAAPYGEWYSFLNHVLLPLGFEYSSEFSYDYDNLPSKTLGGVLQIPIHPICIGSLRRHSYTDNTMNHYFEYVLQKKLALNEPVFLYHHPRDGHLSVLEYLFSRVRALGIPCVTFHEYAHWWFNRSKEHYTCALQDSTLVFTDVLLGSSSAIRILLPSGNEYFVYAPSMLPLNDIETQSLPAPSYAYPGDYERICQFNYRIPLIRWTDAITTYFRKVWTE
ncbi:MAG: hypothetical protein N3A63_04240 [Bacteroidetes bacterium]|nr:hypothetical protein [Bacteroidota bacterium]